jgi:hypothetical protein
MSLKAIPPLKKESATAVLDEPVSAEHVSAIAEKTQIADTSATPITTDGILALVAALTQQNALMQKQLEISQKAQLDANEKLAAAIIETTKPREVLKTREQIAREANDKMFEAQAKELRQRQKETKEYGQDLCDHIAGGLGETKDVHLRTSIIWHRTDAQVDIGICTTCGRQFHPEDPLDKQGRNYTYWRRKGSFNRISAAGTRQFMDPLKAMHDSYLRDS